jgi:protein ImuB
VSARHFVPAPSVVVLAQRPDGAPSQWCWRGRTHRTTRVEAVWTVTTGWWRGDDAATARDYYRLRTRAGLLCVLYRDRVTGSWYLDQVLD